MKNFLTIMTLLCSHSSFAQSYTESWQRAYSFNEDIGMQDLFYDNIYVSKVKVVLNSQNIEPIPRGELVGYFGVDNSCKVVLKKPVLNPKGYVPQGEFSTKNANATIEITNSTTKRDSKYGEWIHSDIVYRPVFQV